MKPPMYMLLAFFAWQAAAASPCRGVSAPMPPSKWPSWAPEIAKQLQVERVDPLRFFQVGDWRIIMVNTHVSDDAFLFYSGEPTNSKYVTVWGGVALPEEEAVVREWVVKNAPGIPAKLAKCFAYHVTREPYP